MSARKDDQNKPPLSLIPRSAILAEARVMAHGAKRYGPHNWRGGMSWSRLIDAAMRHLAAYGDGEDLDNGPDGTGESHLANARCCLAFLIEYAEKGLGEDDRYRSIAAPEGDEGAEGPYQRAVPDDGVICVELANGPEALIRTTTDGEPVFGMSAKAALGRGSIVWARRDEQGYLQFEAAFL